MHALHDLRKFQFLRNISILEFQNQIYDVRNFNFVLQNFNFTTVSQMDGTLVFQNHL